MTEVLRSLARRYFGQTLAGMSFVAGALNYLPSELAQRGHLGAG